MTPPPSDGKLQIKIKKCGKRPSNPHYPLAAIRPLMFVSSLKYSRPPTTVCTAPVVMQPAIALPPSPSPAQRCRAPRARPPSAIAIPGATVGGAAAARGAPLSLTALATLDRHAWDSHRNVLALCAAGVPKAQWPYLDVVPGSPPTPLRCT